MEKNSKIFVAGHRGLVGSAIVRTLQNEGCNNLILRTRAELDLTNQQAVAEFFAKEKPEYVFLSAAKVGGIMANKTHPAEFIYENLTIQTNIIHSSHKNNVKKLLFLGSSCIYPRNCHQPMKEEYLLSGELEPTNKAYSLAKIAGIAMCQSYNEQYGTNFISLMPSNVYGPHDNFDLESAHVVPSVINKFHNAKINNDQQVVMWGTGSAMREFLHVDDLADACLFLMQNYNDSSIINVGSGEDVTIKELTEIVSDVVGYEGKIIWDTTKPDGMPRKLVDVSKLHSLGWKHDTHLHEGIASTYEWFKENYKHD
ncbi:MAG: NAD-dependent epimerase/dehydratase [Candidatus Nomurabacteria bacterium GW2011_GWA2_42_41]|nr:MAG: NAD-dependent epimerase/dehydratase [Candidatus Nomurabacteria bacterium GW2011_GWA2_42_41]